MVYLKSTTKLRLVLDTNIIISALVNKKSTIRDILLTDKITFYLPELVLAELLKHKELLCKKTGLNRKEVFFTIFYILSKVEIVKKEAFSENLEKAKTVMEKIDVKDSEFVALAMSLENDGIFSNDRHFDDSGIKRWTVEEIVRWLELQ
ncbi:MAG: PIN domain-containing protein [Candidatus Methanoperedens sp.]|nr:PIN domain-containing protein [Candidatus Methanoperedens sp.]